MNLCLKERWLSSSIRPPCWWCDTHVWPTKAERHRGPSEINMFLRSEVSREAADWSRSQGGLWGIQLCWADCEGLPANTNTRGGSQIHPPAIVEPRQALPLSQHATDSAGRAGGGEGRGTALALQTVFIHSFDLQVSVFFLFPVLLILFVVSFHLKTETAERFRLPCERQSLKTEMIENHHKSLMI